MRPLKQTYKRELQKRTTKENYKKDLQKRPTKETYKRDLCIWKETYTKRHTEQSAVGMLGDGVDSK